MRLHAVQYTVRGVPGEVDLVLRERAKRQKTSVNHIIVEELTKATVGRTVVTDFSDLVGRWKPDSEFDEVMESHRTIDSEDWR